MTEEEAKTKWCPFVRLMGPVIAGATATTNRPYSTKNGIGGNSSCIASGCMMWEWEGRDDGTHVATGRGHILKAEARGDCGLKRRPP